MKLLFFGSGEFGLPTAKLLAEQHQLAAVITQPDRPAGRKRQLRATPIGQWAQTLDGVEVIKSDNVNTPEAIAKVASFEADASIVIAFGQKLSPELIDAMGKLAVNLHASLLPKYRGAAPINFAMMQGETQTGVSVIALAQRMDAGLIYATRSLDIDPHETAGELHDRLAMLGPDAIADVLTQLASDNLQPVEQDEMLATKAPKLSKADGTVDFDQASNRVRCLIHGLTPWPGCRVNWQCQHTDELKPLSIHRVAADEATLSPKEQAASPGTVLEGLRVRTADGAIRLIEVQTAGTKVMAATDFARGHHLAAGDVLASLTL